MLATIRADSRPEEQPLEPQHPTSMADQGISLRTQVFAHQLSRVRKWLWLGLGILYCLSFNGQWLITPDSAGYLIVAKSFAVEGRLGHPLDFADHIGPGFPILMGYLIRLFGPESFWAFDLALLLLVPINLALVYWLIKVYADEHTAVVVTLFTGVTHLFFSYAFLILADWPFVTGVLLYLTGVGYLQKHIERWWVWTSLILLGLAVMACMRSVFILLPLATVIALPVHWIRQRQLTRLTYAGVALAVALTIGFLFTPGSTFKWMRGDIQLLIQTVIYQLPQTARRVATEGWWEFFSDALPRASFGADLGPWPNAALSVLLTVAVFRLVRTNLVWALVIMCFMAQTLLFFISQRYLLPVIPLLAYAWWDLLCVIDVWGSRRAKRHPWTGVLGVGMLWFWVVANLVKIVGFTWKQHEQPFWDNYRDGRYAGLVQTREAVQQHTPGNSLILTQRKWVAPLMYLTGRLATDTPRLSLANERPVFAVLHLDDTEPAFMERYGWRVEREQATPIVTDGALDLWLAPIRIAAPDPTHGPAAGHGAETIIDEEPAFE